MDSLLTKANLEAGICYWRSIKTRWPPDFHNKYYDYLRSIQSNGLVGVWWETIVRELRSWQASRGKTDAFIRERGIERLTNLQVERDLILRSADHQELGLENVSWETISGLYECARSIKNVNSPVFGSKLCHFILRKIFPVIDHEVIGVDGCNYAGYWQFCKVQWIGRPRNLDLKELLTTAIGERVGEHYPWSTKITELCIIGDRNRGLA